MSEPSKEALEWVYGALCENRPTAWSPTTIRRVALAIDKAVAEEREACAKVADDWSDNQPYISDAGIVSNLIRDRGKP